MNYNFFSPDEIDGAARIIRTYCHDNVQWGCGNGKDCAGTPYTDAVLQEKIRATVEAEYSK